MPGLSHKQNSSKIRGGCAALFSKRLQATRVATRQDKTNRMGTLYQESALHRSLRLSMGGFCVSDYIKRFTDCARIMFTLVIVAGFLRAVIKRAKDKSEESGAKPKHVLSNRGTQTESKKPLEETKSVKKPDEVKGACEKVNTSSAVASKAESKAQPKDRPAQQQGTEGAGKTPSSKSCPQQRDIDVRAPSQSNGLPSVHQDRAGSHSAAAEAQEAGRAPGPAEGRRQRVPQEPGSDGGGAGRDGIGAGSDGIRAGSDGIRAGSDGSRAGSDGSRAGSDGSRAGSDGSRAGSDGSRAGSDGSRAGSDGSRAGSDGSRAGSDGSRAGSDGSRAGSDGSRAGSDGSRAGSDGSRAGSDGSRAGSDGSRAGSDGSRAGSDGSRAGSDGSRAGSDGSRAGSDGSRAGSDGSRAGSDGSRAGSDGSRAGSDGSRAGSDGSRAGSDGSRAGSDGSRAGSDGSRAGSDGSRAGSDGSRAGSDGIGAAAAGPAWRGALPSTPRPGDTGGEVTHTRISISVHMTDVKEKIEMAKEGNVSDSRGKSPKVKSTPADLKGVKQLPDKLKLQQSPKNISSKPNSEVKGDNKQNELVPQTGKQQPFLSKPKPAEKAEEKSELKCEPKTSQNTSAKEPVKDAGVKVKIHQETAKAEKSPADARSERRESESAGGSRHDAQCTGKAPEKTKFLEAGRALPTQGEIIDDSPSPPAPFEHRIVSVKAAEVTSSYSVCRHQLLGGGRFGQVHKCTEISTGLHLAAKIIKVKGAKEKEEVKNEINIMNQLNHVNLIQLYDAFEAKNNITLIMEYLDGGELFDRITDENYHLTELDAILFTKQICEGVHYLHQHYILHLDLKPENILCVNHTGNQIKIIDFGLARRYKPCEKLKVNFGTPEFLAPEVVNYDFVSFPTDMWSVGVITYMLLSGLSPFLGETDAETMNYVVNCSWDFDAEAFEQLSEDAKDFISRLLVKEKSCRMSATQCLKHEWLSNLPAKAQQCQLRLKSQLLLQSYMAHRKWKKHFYVVAAANRLKRFQSTSVKLA
uniref:Myosin light chain kinase 3 n=1 Tax=Ficedula albicollis TaxID=59894 RepID=A0A803WG10_FICAL